MSTAQIVEVGPRDGLQSVQSIMPTADKLTWIDALYAAGLREIEVGSFVPAKSLPQMADIEAVVAHALKLPDLTVAALVPNLKGVEKAFATGVHKITIPASVSEAHLQANIRKTHAQIIEEVKTMVTLRDEKYQHVQIEAGLSTAFGCTLQGKVPEDDVIRMVRTMADCGVDEVGPSDTTGYANPAQVRRLFTRVRQTIGERTGGGHFHNTRGLGLANVLAAWDVGVVSFDSFMAGLGGCPVACCT